MKFKIIAATSLLTAGIVSLPSRANAELVLTLELDNPAIVVQPFDEVDLFATLTNENSSSEDFVGANFIANPGVYSGNLAGGIGSNIRPYRVEFPVGANSVIDQIRSVTLSPGESHTFLFSTLIPQMPPVMQAVYESEGVNLMILGSLTLQSFRLDSTSGLSVTVVPEPSALLLAMTAGLGLVERRRRAT